MKRLVLCIWFVLLNRVCQYAICGPSVDMEDYAFLNRTTPSDRQLNHFKLQHPESIGVSTTSSGLPVEVRETTALNNNQYVNQLHVDLMKDFTNARIPERFVHAKGTGAWGYFEVTHNVSNYTSAAIFNRIGKITPAFARFSQTVQSTGGNDLSREPKAIAVKFYTSEGNLDFLCLNIPIFLIKDPINFQSFIAANKKNPKTNSLDFTMFWDFVSKKSETLGGLFFILSDYGLPNGYRKSDYFPIHTYEVRNNRGDRHFVKFNFRTSQRKENLQTADAELLAARDTDYFNRDLYDAIEEKKYPAWNLEMDVIAYDDVLRCGYDPFDVTRLWATGSYHTVPIGRLVLDKNPDNYFRDVEQAAFNPANLVPGIPGPIDSLFRARHFAYRDTQIHRLGINHNKIHVNAPIYRKEYNRDGVPPVLDNMNDAPMYFPNSFSGPIPYVDKVRPKRSFSLLQSRAVDLDVPANFYNNYIVTDDQKGRFVNNTVSLLLSVAPYMKRRVLRLFSLINSELGVKLTRGLLQAERRPGLECPKILVPLRKNSTDVFKQNCK